MKNIHSTAIIGDAEIGECSRIWQFSIIFDGAKIGSYANICAHCMVESDVVIGDNVTIKNGVYLWDGLRVGDNVFIGPNATFTNDLHPRSKQYPEKYMKTIIKNDVSIGAGAVVLCGVTIHEGAMIGAGAVVINDVPANATVVGNPARII